uniref:Uncharacterized protein n=1 Tax=Romanomermis culicivorax TaxID=13658 RepID=A0A915IWK4_ROMCU
MSPVLPIHSLKSAMVDNFILGIGGTAMIWFKNLMCSMKLHIRRKKCEKFWSRSKKVDPYQRNLTWIKNTSYQGDPSSESRKKSLFKSFWARIRDSRLRVTCGPQFLKALKKGAGRTVFRPLRPIMSTALSNKLSDTVGL